MKKNKYIWHLAILTLFLGVFACRKTLDAVVVTQTPHDSTVVHQDSTPVKHDSTQLAKKPDSPAVQPPFPQTPAYGCQLSPIYGDTIIFPQPTSGSDYIFRPVNSPGTGKYFSWPMGMVIDSASGAIDVTKSQTGQRYAIGFVKGGTKDTCISQLIIGGADYMDSVYVLADGQLMAMPYFDANPYLPPVCNGSGPGSGCSFDVTGSAATQKVIVDHNTGAIDLQKTLNGTTLLGGAFGLLPLDGQVLTTTIYYKLNDPSNNALQHIDVQLVYYGSKSAIGSGTLLGVLNKVTNILNLQLISTSYNPRPPLVFIVRRN
jgi:hypothetical protein